MIKSIKLSVVVIVATLIIVGCGSSGSSSDTSADVRTGIGYYVDSPIEGIGYACGKEFGTTDTEGKFTFEKGQECKFTLAGILLRTTKADNLEDGRKILEDNLKVAKFLQSIDADGNLDNGIQITDEVLIALTTALEASNSVGILPEGAILTEVVASVGHDVEGVSGDVRTNEQVKEHLFTQPQSEITRKLLAGKTFYVVKEEKGKPSLFKMIVNNEASSLQNYNLNGEFIGDADIDIIGNKIIYADGSYVLVSQKDGYIFADNRNAYGSKSKIFYSRFYSSQSDAQAYYDSLKPQISTSSLKDLIVGKTYYLPYEGTYIDEAGYNVIDNHVETLVFETDEKTLDISWIHPGWVHFSSNERKESLQYDIQKNVLTISNTDDSHYERIYFRDSFSAPVVETSNYILFSKHEHSRKFFKTYAAAAATINITQIHKNISITQNMLNEKVFYFSNSKEDDTWAYVKVTVQSNNQMSFHEIRLKNSDNTRTMDTTRLVNYTLSNGILVLDLENGNRSFELHRRGMNGRWEFIVTEENGTKFEDSWFLYKYFSSPSDL